MIGRHPGWDSPDIVIACGFSGHGFKFVPAVGEVLADLILDATTRHSIDLFDPMRFTEVRAAASKGGNTLVGENA